MQLVGGDQLLAEVFQFRRDVGHIGRRCEALLGQRRGVTGIGWVGQVSRPQRLLLGTGTSLNVIERLARQAIENEQ